MEDNVQVRWHKIAFVTILLVLAGLLNEFVLAYIHDIVGHEPLPDFVFWLIPEVPIAAKIGDIIVMILALSLFCLFFVHKNRAVIIMRSFFCIAVLYYMRIISLFFTQLPPCFSNFEERCESQLNESERNLGVYLKRMLKQTFHVGFQDMDNRILCGDLLFSGHTLIMVSCAWMIAYYLPTPKPWFKYLGYFPKISALIGMICMIISRGHYSVDVIFAYWLTIGVFTTYHSYAEIYLTEERKSAAVSYWLIIRIVVAWLERNVSPGKVENEFHIPFLPWIEEKIQNFRLRNEYNDIEDHQNSEVAILIDPESHSN